MQLRPARVRISPTAKLTISHLLVVSGASGSGKSVFMRALANGELTDEFAAVLPPGVEEWPHTNGSRILGQPGGKANESEALQLEGVVLHYDIMRVFETRISDYADDPALAALAKAKAITIVLIEPPVEMLIGQLARKPQRPGSARRALKQIERWANRALRPSRSSVYLTANHEARHRRLAARYKAPDFLPAHYAGWRQFVERTVGDRLVRPIVEVAPADASGGGFRIVDRPSEPSRPAS